MNGGVRRPHTVWPDTVVEGVRNHADAVSGAHHVVVLEKRWNVPIERVIEDASECRVKKKRKVIPKRGEKVIEGLPKGWKKNRQ